WKTAVGVLRFDLLAIHDFRSPVARRHLRAKNFGHRSPAARSSGADRRPLGAAQVGAPPRRSTNACRTSQPTKMATKIQAGSQVPRQGRSVRCSQARMPVSLTVTLYYAAWLAACNNRRHDTRNGSYL